MPMLPAIHVLPDLYFDVIVFIHAGATEAFICTEATLSVVEEIDGLHMRRPPYYIMQQLSIFLID